MDSFGFDDESPNIFIKLKRKKIKNSIAKHVNLIDKRFSFNKTQTKSKKNNNCHYQIVNNYYYIPRTTSVQENFDLITPQPNKKSIKIVKYPDKNISIKDLELISSPLKNKKITSEIKIFNKTAKIIEKKSKNFTHNNYNFLANNIELSDITNFKNNPNKENIKFNINQNDFLNNTSFYFEDNDNNNKNVKISDIPSKELKMVEMRIHKIRNKNNKNIFQRDLMKNWCYRIRKIKNSSDIKKNLRQKLGQKMCNSFLNETANFNNKSNFKSSFTHLNKDIINNNKKIHSGQSCFNLLLGKQNIYKPNPGVDYFKTDLEKEIQDLVKNKTKAHCFNIPPEKKIGFRLKCLKADLKFFDIK